MPKWLNTILIVMVFTVAVAAVMAPIGPLPGFRIGGTATPPPQTWNGADIPDTVQLKTNGGLFPRVVNIWMIEANNDLYAFGASDSGWVKSTLGAPAVEVRIHDSTYALTATSVPDLAPETYQKYIDKYQADYPDIVAQMPSVEDMAGAGIAFRLSR